MPLLIRERALGQIDKVFGLSALEAAGQRPPNGVALLAEKTGIPHHSLRNAVYGHAQVARYRAVLIAEALGVKVGWLMGEDGVPDEPPSKDQEQETNTGPGRDGGSGSSPGKAGKGTGPKRVRSAA